MATSGRLAPGVAPGGPWTTHGHPVEGVTVDGPGRPAKVARCGGPGLCAVCSADAERLRRIEWCPSCGLTFGAGPVCQHCWRCRCGQTPAVQGGQLVDHVCGHIGRAAAPQETPRDRGRDAQEAAEAHLAVCEKWLERIETEDVGEDDDGPAMAGPYDGCGVCDQRETIAAAWPHALAAAADLIEEAALAVDVETGARGRFVGLLREEARRATLAGLEPPA